MNAFISKLLFLKYKKHPEIKMVETQGEVVTVRLTNGNALKFKVSIELIREGE